MGTIKVLIVDDQVTLRECLKFNIEQDKDIEVVGCAGNGKEAFELCAFYNPDLVLMDIVMPVCDGIEGTRLIKERYRQMKVIILTFDDDQNAKAIQNGADGYILKDLKPTEIITIIKNTVKGYGVFHQKAIEPMKKQYITATNETVDPKVNLLTEKEIDVIKLVVKGKSNREIGETLSLSEGRVRNIITEILSKLGFEDRTQLAVWAVRNNLDKDTKPPRNGDTETHKHRETKK